jgi:hypothetical protein
MLRDAPPVPGRRRPALALTPRSATAELRRPACRRTDLTEKRVANQEIPALRAYLVVETEWIYRDVGVPADPPRASRVYEHAEPVGA